LNYRPDIDGLRAIAVLSVVFYHAGLGFPGGYVGVDVFFVISGYLITALILKDLERGLFSMANFWERRIRRIFPALAVMVAVTCVAGWFLLLPEDLAKLGASVIAQSLLVSNFYFWRTTNYFGGANEEKPLLHTWSLAVEEQFYLIFPIALMGFWWAWTRWQKAQADGILGTTNHTNLHENFTTDDTDEHGWGNRKAAPGEPGLALSSQNPSTSELARACENTSLTRSASIPAGAHLAREMGSSGENQLADSMEFLEGQTQAGLQMDSQILNSIREAKDSGTSGSNSSSVSISVISGKKNSGAPEAHALHATSDSLPVTSPIGEKRRWALFWIFAAVALVSFGLSIWGMKAQPFATFFLLPTRAWELLLGSMLAVLPATVFVRNFALREILCLAGLAGIFLPVFFYGEQTPFPGLAALPPCLGTAALIWANTAANRDVKRGWAASALSWSPVVFIGLISYSLYLWHWPVICYTSYWAVAEFTAMEKWGLVLASVVLAAVSWRWVEKPFRKKMGVFTSRKTVVGMALLVSLFLGCAGWCGYQSNGFPRRVNAQVLAVLEDLENDRAERQKFAHLAPNISDYSQAKLKSLPRIGQQNGAPLSFAVMGDSHAQVAMPLFDELAKKYHKSGVAITHQGTPPLMGWNITQRGGASDPAGLWSAAFNFIREEKIQDVFLLGYWSSYDPEELNRRAVETIEKFSNAGINIWILKGAPTYHQNVARMYLRKLFFKNINSQTESVVHHNQKQPDTGMLGVVQKTFPDRIIDVSEGFLDQTSGEYHVAANDRLFYFDNNHLTNNGINILYYNKIKKTMELQND